MPSWTGIQGICANGTFSNISAADTHLINSLLNIPDGFTRPESPQQILHHHAPKKLHPTANPANAQTDLRHGRYNHELQHPRPQQGKIPPSLNPHPLHQTLLSSPLDSNDPRQQHVRRAAPSSPNYSVDNPHERGFGARGRRPDCSGGCCVPGIAWEVSRRGGCEEPAAGGAFVCAAAEEEEGEAQGEVAFEAQGFYVLDGAQDQGKGSQDGGKGGDGRGLSVREWVAVLEARGKKKGKEIAAPVVQPPVKKVDDGATKPKVPIVYPLHYKRFVRRTSSRTPLRPDTPLYRSIPDDEPMIHAPMPTRSFPALKTPPETPRVERTPRAGPAASSMLSQNPINRSEGITPPSFLKGTRNNCVRHGRKPTLAASKYMVAKSRSGAYIPTGLPSLRQMEATSPWAIPNRSLTKTDASKSVANASDACPDCVAELNIKRRELLGGSIATMKRPTGKAQPTTSSAFGEPSLPASKQRSGQVNSLSNQESEEEETVISKDLGEGLDAVIVEHRGDLRRVVVNSRHGQPTVETMQRLSRELAEVSNSVASAGVKPRPLGPGTKRQDRDCAPSAVIMDSMPRPRDVRTSSVPELLDLIDQAANEIHSNTGRIAEHYINRHESASGDRQSLLSSDELNNVLAPEKSPTHGLVSRQSMDDHLMAMEEYLAAGTRKNSVQSVASIAPSTCQRPSGQPTASKPTPIVTQIAKTPGSNVPKLLETRPTLPPAAVAKPPNASPTQTPPPEHPSLHHAPELDDVRDTFKALATALTPTPKNSYLSNLLHPFHHRTTPQTATPQRKPALSAPQTVPLPPSPYTEPPSTQPKATQDTPPNPPAGNPTSKLPVPVPLPIPQRTDSPSPPPGAAAPPIVAHPNPYHHAPHTPVSINKAAYSDPRLREQQGVIRAAMRMAKDKNSDVVKDMDMGKVQEAAVRVERERRGTRFGG